MHIEIANFHNIASLDYEIEAGKVNFLYGVSGSGKSSIVKGIAQDINQEVDARVGRASGEQATVKIDGDAGPLESTTTFNGERQSVLFSSDPSRSSYDVFIGNEDELDALCMRYRAAVSTLRAKTGDLLDLKNKVETLKKTLGATGKKGFTRASKMGKAIEAYGGASPAAREHVEQHGMEAEAWIKQGFTVNDSYSEGVCPFCGQSLEQSPERNVLAELCELSVKDLKPLLDSPNQLRALGQPPIDVSTDEGRESARKIIAALPVVSAEVDRIVGYCNVGSDFKTVEDMAVEALDLNPAILTFMPELGEITAEVNARAKEVKSLLGQMKAVFNALVKKSCDELNHNLRLFGIPYRFELSEANRDEKKASYRLVHVAARDSTDMRESLSFGERNLITLMLFLRDEESRVLLIDDPASSYDDYRRTQIFKAIMGVKGRTLLVVSHDQAFVRRAVRFREHQQDRIGKVDMLCNRSGRASVEPITKDSFRYFEDIIRDRIASASTYYQRMLSVRLLCDARHVSADDQSLWGYVSAILHRTNRETVLSLLAKAGESEDAVLERLRDLAGGEASTYIVPLPENVDYSTDGFSEFERLVALREDIETPGGGSALPKGVSKELALDLLNDLVHMNDAMMDCIDPYRYPVWSPVLFELLES